MKIIFLDVDGVLNTISDYRLYGPDFINMLAVSRLSKIIKATNSKIVVSSNWRLEEKSRKILHQALGKYNLEIYDYTVRRSKKSQEIKIWLDENEIIKFAIIDDDPRASLEASSFFKINEEFGLTEDKADEIIRYLNE